MRSQITADLLDIDRALRVATRNLAHEGDEKGSLTSSGEVVLTLMKGTGLGLSWKSPERRSRNTRKHVRDLTGRKLIMLGKKQYIMVDSDKQKKLHWNNEWIATFNLKRANKLQCVERVERLNMIENQDSVLRRTAKGELELKAWWTKWSVLQEWLAWLKK